MRVYISGQISGLEMSEVIKKFAAAEELLRSVGFDPVNPLKNGLPASAPCDDHMIADITMLMPCEAIFMIRDWVNSRGARIEHKIAEEMGKMFLFEETYIQSEARKLFEIKNAIKAVTGFAFEDYTIKCNKPSLFFARLIFVSYCIEYGLIAKDIAKMVNRSIDSINRYPRDFARELNHNKRFKNMVSKVNDLLKNNVSQ